MEKEECFVTRTYSGDPARKMDEIAWDRKKEKRERFLFSYLRTGRMLKEKRHCVFIGCLIYCIISGTLNFFIYGYSRKFSNKVKKEKEQTISSS